MARLLHATSPSIPSGSVPQRVGKHAARRTLCCVDWSKFYSRCLMELDYVPVVSLFDGLETGPGLTLGEPGYLYFVDVLSSASDMYPVGSTVLFPEEAAHMPCGVETKVVARLALHKQTSKPVREAVEAVYACSGLSAPFQKAMVNKVIGKCGKKYVRRKQTVICNNYVDAQRMAALHNGYAVGCPDDPQLWAVTWTVAETEISESYLLLHLAVLAKARVKMQRLVADLQEGGYVPLGYRTDCVFVHAQNMEPWLLAKGYTVGSQPGSIKLEYSRGQTAALPGHPLPSSTATVSIPASSSCAASSTGSTSSTCALPPTQRTYTHAQDVQSLDNRTALLCRAGRGKTSTAIRVAQSQYGGGVLVVCAWNAQVHMVKDTFGVDACTASALFGMDSTGAFKHTPVDVRPFRVIIFDEILLLPHRFLIITQRYMEHHPEKVFLSTGDDCQLDAIDHGLPRRLRMQAIAQMFPNQVSIAKSVRMADGELLEALERDLFEEGMSLAAVAAKYFRTLTFDEAFDAGARQCVAYFNATVDAVNNLIHSRIHKLPACGGRPCIRKGDTLVCRENFWHTFADGQRRKFCNNQQYTVRQVGRTKLAVQFDATGRVAELPVRVVHKSFALGYAATVHSSQGRTVEGMLMLADWKDNSLATRQWFYTAVTRVQDFTHIILLDGVGVGGGNISREAASMVDGYKSQDAAAGRKHTDADFVDARWILAAFHACAGVCRSCGMFMSFEKHAATKVTVNRLDNALPHVTYNCELLCKQCNYGT